MGLRIVYNHLYDLRKALGVCNSIEILNAVLGNPDFCPYLLKLSPRGALVFENILKGVSDRQIGEKLGMSYSGVRRHKENMLFANKCDTVHDLIAKYYSRLQRQQFVSLLSSLLEIKAKS